MLEQVDLCHPAHGAESDFKYFQPGEFRCSHTGLALMVPEFVTEADRFRDQCGFPFRLTSAFRDVTHPIEAAKVAPGPHNTGLAIDIQVSHKYAHKLMMMLGVYEPLDPRLGFFGVGWAQRGDVASRFVHLDACSQGPGRPRPHVWSY